MNVARTRARRGAREFSVLEKGGDARALRNVPHTDEQVAARGWPARGHAT